MTEILNPKSGIPWGKIIASILLGLFYWPAATVPWLISTKDNAAIIAEMARVVKKMVDDGAYKNEYEVLYNSLDNDGPLKL